MNQQEFTQQFEAESNAVINAYMKNILIDELKTKVGTKHEDLSEYSTVLERVLGVEKAIDGIHALDKDFPTEEPLALGSLNAYLTDQKSGKKDAKKKSPHHGRKSPSSGQGPEIPQSSQ